MYDFKYEAEPQDDEVQTMQLQKNIKKIWAKNGDVISFQYTGTESNITRVTTKNKQGVMGKLE